MDKRVLIPGFLIILLGATIAIYSPYNSLSRLDASIDSIVLHKADSSSTIFIVYMDFTNPTNMPIIIGEIDGRMQINGTDYNSLALVNEIYEVPARGELRVSVPVMSSGSPVGYQQDGLVVKYMLETDITIEKSTSIFGVYAEKPETLGDIRSWTYNKELS